MTTGVDLAPMSAGVRTEKRLNEEGPLPKGERVLLRLAAAREGRFALAGRLANQNLDELLAECRQILRRARGDQVAVDDDLGVLELGASVDQVGLNRRHARGAATADDVRLGQHPARMADGRHQFPAAVQVADQADHGRIAAHAVWRKAARDNHAVELVGAHVAGCNVRLGRIAMAAGVGFARLFADQLHLSAGGAQPQRWVPELKILVVVRDEDCDALAFQ